MADYVLDQIGGKLIRSYIQEEANICTPNHSADRLPQIYYALNRLSVETGAFSQLTRKYMSETFNPNTPDVKDVRCVHVPYPEGLYTLLINCRYFSYGAAFEPSIWSVFRLSHKILAEVEGPNDGLVSVASSHWGDGKGYKGTLMGVSHLDLINWSNRLKWLAGEVMGQRRKFNAIALYLDIAGTKCSRGETTKANFFIQDMLAKEGL